MKILLLLLLSNCWSSSYYADIDIQYNPAIKFEKEDLVYINKNIDKIEDSKVFYYLKTNLCKENYKISEKREGSKFIIEFNLEKNINFEIKSQLIPESRIKNRIILDNTNMEFKRKEQILTNYKEVFYKKFYYTYKLYVNIYDNFKKEILKSFIEVDAKEYDKNNEIYIEKLVQNISSGREIRNQTISWKNDKSKKS